MENNCDKTIGKVGKYRFAAEPFHCDCTHHLFMGHLGNHMLNAADFHSKDRGFGMDYLNPRNMTWVLSRLAIEMEEMPPQYTDFDVETWVEGAMRYFTNRNFKVSSPEGKTYGYGKSIWALIDTNDRQPQDILAIKDGEIKHWLETDKECPIERGSRVKMSDKAQLVRTIDTYYNDIDVNGHVNSIKYIEHVLDLFPLDMYKQYLLKRLDIAYVAESHYGDQLSFWVEEDGNNGDGNDNIETKDYCIRITKGDLEAQNSVEVCRCKVCFVKR